MGGVGTKSGRPAATGIQVAQGLGFSPLALMADGLLGSSTECLISLKED